jgi:hypothetical protein
VERRVGHLTGGGRAADGGGLNSNGLVVGDSHHSPLEITDLDGDDDRIAAQVAGSFGKQLNSHGFGFQHGVMRRAQDLKDGGRSGWVCEAVEVPVRVAGEDTRIDLVLQRHPGTPFYMLAECKRANPSLSNWCFARAPFVHRGRRAANEPVMLERVTARPHGQGIKSAVFPRNMAAESKVCHIALDVRSNEKGEQHDSGRGAIEKAASQIMRGLNGFVDLLATHQAIMKGHPLVIIPVIFTTARLWLSHVDLSESDLRSGEVDLKNSAFESVPWVCYQYHLSPGIKHSYWAGNAPDDIPSLLDLDFIRSIFVVGPDGMEDFFYRTSFWDIDV